MEEDFSDNVTMHIGIPAGEDEAFEESVVAALGEISEELVQRAEILLELTQEANESFEELMSSALGIEDDEDFEAWLAAQGITAEEADDNEEKKFSVSLSMGEVPGCYMRENGEIMYEWILRIENLLWSEVDTVRERLKDLVVNPEHGFCGDIADDALYIENFEIADPVDELFNGDSEEEDDEPEKEAWFDPKLHGNGYDDGPSS